MRWFLALAAVVYPAIAPAQQLDFSALDRLASKAKSSVNVSLDEDKLERAGLTFEVTPPTADDGYGGWWISIYDAAAIERARASDAEMKTIAVEAPAPKNETPAETKKPARKSREPSTSDRVYIQDYTREEGAYVRPPL